MTRKSKRELERALEDLDDGDADDGPMTVRITEHRVDEHGDVVETGEERVIEYDCRGPDLDVTETVVETSWDGPDRADGGDR